MKDKELILLLDDCRWNREMLRGFLLHQGYRVLTASSGHDAVEVVRHHHPDLILMDLSGFRPDRFKALQWVKGQSEYRDTPVSLSSLRRRLQGWFTKGRSRGSLCAKLLGA